MHGRHLHCMVAMIAPHKKVSNSTQNLLASQICDVKVNDNKPHVFVRLSEHEKKGQRMATRLISVDEVCEQLGVSRAYAYKVIRNLNDELVVKGKVSAEYFERKYFGAAKENHKEQGEENHDVG